MENENRYIQTYIFFLKLVYLYLFLRQKGSGVFSAGYAGDDVTGSHSLDYREKSVKLNYYAGSIGYSLKGTLSYDKSKLGTVSLECGIKKSLSYNDAGLISGISYSSDKNISLTTGYEYLYDRNFNITERTHKDTGNKDVFTYDSLNRLVSSKLKGKFTNDTYEQFAMYNMNEIDRDIDGMKNEGTLNGQFFPADKVTLDEKGKSFVYDFAEEKEIQKIELFKTNLEKNSRIRERDLHIYIKLDEADEWSELTPDCWNYEVDSKNQSIHFNFKETVTARFIKIRTIWDDRDIDNNNVSEYVTFTNESVQKMIRIWTIENSKDEFYKYDKNSNRITLETYTTKNDYAYYKNSNNGNTARVMYDGKWWYTYDANGNRTARAMNAEHNGNVVNIDKSDEYWEYEWDYHNRLVKVQQFNAPDNAQNVKVEYTYDAMNRRIERISYTGETSELTQYAYGRNGALTYQEKTAGSSVTTRSFVYLNNQIIGFMDTENSTESIRYAVTDIQGSVTEVYDEDGSLLWKSGYTAFGIKAGETTILIDFDGLYTGCDYDAETGLTYHWNRWRSEDGSTWLSQDSARDGSNWYGYAGCNPMNNVDILGLYQLPIYSQYIMQNYSNIYRNGTDQKNAYNSLSQSGCAIVACANMLSIMSPEQVNQDYVTNGSIQWAALAKDTNYELDDCRGSQFTVSQYNKQRKDNNYEYQTLVNVNYDKSKGDGGDHWVGVKGVATKKNGNTWTDYVIIAASSKYDSSIITGKEADRKGRGWLYEDGNIYVPVSQTNGYINFKTKNFGETFRQVLIKVFSYNKKKDECLTTPEQEVSQPPVSPEPQGPTGPTGPASSQEQEKSSNTKTGIEGV